MKKILSIITITAAIALVITSCKSNTAPSLTKSVSFDDTVGLAQFQQWKAMNERENYTAYMNAVNQALPVKTVIKKSSSKSGSMSSSTTNNAKVAKKGMSKSAKYAIIGGGGGAVLGAILNKKNRVAGGIIGGILGGGIGYGIGRSKDKKDGR